MKVILRIGFMTYLLPNDSNLDKVIKTMMQAVECTDFLSGIEVRERKAVQIEVRYVTANEKIRFAKEEECEPKPKRKVLSLTEPSSIIIPPEAEASETLL